MKAGSSFQRKSNPMESISGCYKSSYTHHILTSTGVPQLDYLIGGGMPIGTLMLIEEDYAGSYAKLLMKYFLSENPQSIIQNLPSIEVLTPNAAVVVVIPSYGVFINRNDIQSKNVKDIFALINKNKHIIIGIVYDFSDLGANSGRTFNLNIPISKEVLSQRDIEICDISSCDENKCSKLLEKIHEYVKNKEFLISPGAQMKKSLVRVGVLSLGDILWGEEPTNILTFLLGLRALLRNCMGVGIVTIPSTLHQDEQLAPKLRSIADFLINLTAFDSQENVSPVYKDYHGIIKVGRIASLGVLTPPLHLIKDDNELVFKSRRTKFEIERFHLPPDLSVTASRDQKDPKLKKNIDF